MGRTSAEANHREPQGRRRARRLLRMCGVLIVVGCLAALGTIFYLRSVRFNRIAVDFIESRMAEYGLRAEVGRLAFTLSPQTARLEKLRILNQTSGELIATIDRLEVAAELRDLLAPRRRRVVQLRQVRVEGLEFHLNLDKNGQSNLSGLRSPARDSATIEIDQTRLEVGLTRSRFHLHDQGSGFTLRLDGLNATGRSEGKSGLAVSLTGSGGAFELDGRRSKIDRLALEGVAGLTGMAIRQLRLDSALGEVEAQGSLNSWAPFDYAIDFKTEGHLAEVTRLFAPQAGIAGSVGCQCRIVGQAGEFTLSGQPRSARMSIGKARLEQVALERAILRHSGDYLEFESRVASAARIIIDGILLDRTVVSNPRGRFRRGRTSIDSSRGIVSSIEWPKSRLSDLELTPLRAEFGAGQYRLRAAAKLASGSISGIPIHDARALASLDGETLELESLQAGVEQGSVTASLTLPLGRERPFRIEGQFTALPTRQIFSIINSDFKVDRAPVTGTFSGEAALEWRPGEATSIAGTITASFTGESPGSPGGLPVSGNLRTVAVAGIFDFGQFELRTTRTTLRLGGTLAVSGQSNLQVKVESTLASELVTISHAIDGLKPFLDSNLPHLPGTLSFQGELNGDIGQPVLSGSLRADPVGLHRVEIGSLTGQLLLNSTEVRLTDATLADRQGESGRIALSIPFDPQASTGSLDAKFDRLKIEAIIATLDPGGESGIRDLLDGRLAGEASLTGLPGRINGHVALRVVDGTIVRQPIKSASASISFIDHRAGLDSFTLRLPQTTLQANGSWNLRDDSFAISGQTSNIALSLLAEALDFKLFDIGGAAEISFRMGGEPRPVESGDRPRTETLDWQRLSFTLSATTTGLQLNRRPAGDFRIFAGTNSAGRLRAALTSRGPVEKELVFATVELKDRRLPLTISGELDGIELAPFVAILMPERAEMLRGQVSGSVTVAGPTRNEAGEASVDQLRGNLTISQLDLDVSGNRLQLASPESIELNQSVATLPPVRLVGPGIELVVNGRFGLTGSSPLAVRLRGELDLGRLAGPGPALTTQGRVLIEAQADGTVASPNLSGALDIRNLGLSSSEMPFFLSNGNGLITLTGNQLRINSFRATANDGLLEARGSIALNGLKPAEWRIELKAERAELYFRELSSSLSATLTLAGTPEGQIISGAINTSRLEYNSSLDLDNLVAGGGGVNLDFDPGSFRLFGAESATGSGGRTSIPTRLNLRLEARDTLAIRGEQFNAVGTAVLNVSGTIRDPGITGRLESDSGFVRFRGQRYDLARATLDLLPGNGGTVLNLTAESDFRGYRVSLGLAGQIDAIETTLRSEPALSRDEIISLITTGRTETGSLTTQDPLRSGFGAAASFLTTGLISRPTEQLLGLSRFQIDPIIRPNANPAARLTIGQQLSRNLYVSYSTNLATEQDQTALAEYAFTNRFSALATYSQGGSSTRQGLDENVFTIELRGRQRFSLGFMPGGSPSTTTTDRPGGDSPTPPSAGVPPVAKVTVPAIENLRLRERKLRELLPVMSRGFNRSLARLGERRLREYLQEQGYFFAEVGFRCEPIDCSGATPRVFYDVTPNRVFDLTEIRIEGSERLQIGKFRGQLQSETASRVGGIPFFKDLPLIGGSMRGLTSNERLRSDEETIRRTLVEQGYLGARVRSRLAIRPENDQLLVIFNVDEGPLSRVGEVVIEGNRTIPTSELLRAIPLLADAPYSPALARLGTQQLRQIYSNHGFFDAFTNLEVFPIDEPNGNRLRLTYRITEGNPAIIREILVAGTTRTNPAAISRYFNFRIGELLTPEKLRTTQSALYSTNAFREVNVRVEDLGNAADSAHRVTVNLSEARPLLLVYGLGYSTDDGIRGSVEVANTNLRGSLNSLSLRLRASRREQISQISFADLRPLGQKLPTTINLFYNRSANLRTFVRRSVVNQEGRTTASNEGNGFGLDRYGAFIQSEKKFDPRTSLRFRYNFEQASLFGYDANIFQVPDVTRNERAIRIGMLSFGVTRDTRDNILNPKEGQLISADHSLASNLLGGNESFNKFFATYQNYRTIGPSTAIVGGLLNRSTIAISARIGLASMLRTADRNKDGTISESEDRLPISERFFSGGATTLRGFRFETAGPQEILEPRSDRSCLLPARPCDLPTLVPVGGDALAIFNLELRYPLTERLRLVPFFDAGNVFRRVKAISFSRFSNTIGLGLRINTPIGPVGIDYGILLDPPAFHPAAGGTLRQPRGVFHIRLGQSF